jgi:predicted ABC-type ATPase
MDLSFVLDEIEHKRVYEEIIEPAFFLDTTPVEKPSVVFVGGQPGAGKTRLIERSMSEFDDENVVPINTDELRAFHPKYVEIAQADDKIAAERTHTDASAWNRRLLRRCLETQRNMVVEGVFKDAQGLAEIVKQLRDAGYRVIFRLVAVHARHSILGISSRYEQEKLVRGHGRFVPLSYHNDCYEKILETLNLVESLKLMEQLDIYNRSGELLYSNNVVDGKWQSLPDALNAMTVGRDQELSEIKKAEYRNNWHTVIESMYNRNASSGEITTLKELRDVLCAALEPD